MQEAFLLLGFLSSGKPQPIADSKSLEHGFRMIDAGVSPSFCCFGIRGPSNSSNFSESTVLRWCCEYPEVRMCFLLVATYFLLRGYNVLPKKGPHWSLWVSAFLGEFLDSPQPFVLEPRV